MGWNDERVGLLRKLWTDGLSASQIAKQLGGGVTRNAVIGKVHRLGLAGRATPTRPAKRTARPARARSSVPAVSAQRLRPPAPTQPIEHIPALAPLMLATGRTADVLSLKESMCRFPIGDPTDPAFAFCGRTACSGPYCADHALLAYQPSAPRRRRPDPTLADLRRALSRAIAV